MVEERIVLSGEVLLLPLEAVDVNPSQPRKTFAAGALFELSDSIKKYGVMQPISVRRKEDGFELIAGERRLRASRLAGLKTIPAVVVETSDRTGAVLALVENIQRENLNYIEEAEAFESLIREYAMTQEALAKSLGKSQSAVANKIRLLKLTEDVKKDLLENGLTERHARALLTLPTDDLRRGALKKIVAGGLNVKSAERLVDNILKEEKAQKRRSKVKTYVRDVRLFTNTIRQAVEMMNDGGISTVCEIEDKGDGCFISIAVTY